MQPAGGRNNKEASMAMRQHCTLDWNVRIANHVGYLGAASRCRHVDGTFFVDLGVQRHQDQQTRAFFFQCPSNQLWAMSLIPIADHAKYRIEGLIETVGSGRIKKCESESEQIAWLNDMGLYLYGLPVEYDEHE